MSTCIGHIGGGLIAWELAAHPLGLADPAPGKPAVWRRLAFVAFVSMLPDLDLIQGLAHRQTLHSLFVLPPAALLLGVLAARGYGWPLWRAILFTACVLLMHVFVDLFTGGGRFFGVRLLYPFSGFSVETAASYLPTGLLQYLQVRTLTAAIAVSALMEAATFGALYAAANGLRRRRWALAAAGLLAGAVCMAWSVRHHGGWA